MKNIKRFIALPIACIAATSLVACGGESHSHTFDDAWKNNANKAYLLASAVANANAPMFSLNRGEGTTSIDELSTVNGQQTTVIYDLTGRRVEKMEKGIYIVNGRKVIVK